MAASTPATNYGAKGKGTASAVNAKPKLKPTSGTTITRQDKRVK